MPTTLTDEEKQLAERKEWASEIEALTAAHLKALPGRDAVVDAAAAQVKSAEEVLKEAKEAHRVTLGPRSDAERRFDRQRSLLQGRLRDAAPPELDEFLRELQAESSRLQSSGVSGTVAERQARVASLRDARRQVEPLKFLPLSPAELAERLDAIRNALADKVEA